MPPDTAAIRDAPGATGSEALHKVAQPHARGNKRRATELNRTRRQSAFLKAFATGGIVLRAAQRAGASRRAVYLWLAEDPAFRAKFDLAIESATDLLEAEARRRAEYGWDEPVYQGGQQVGVVRKYSDALMITLLKGLKPSVYKDRIESTVDLDASPLIDARTSSDAQLLARLERAVLLLKQTGAPSTLPMLEPRAVKAADARSWSTVPDGIDG